MEQLRSTRGFRAGKLVLAGKWGGAELSLADLEWVMRAESGLLGGCGWLFWNPQHPCGRSKVMTQQVMSCAKSLQLHLTLRSPVDHSPPGSTVHGILQARILAFTWHLMMNWLLLAFSASFLPLTRFIFCSSQTQSLQILKFCLYFCTQTFEFDTCFASNGLSNFPFLLNSYSSSSTWLPPGTLSMTPPE